MKIALLVTAIAVMIIFNTNSVLAQKYKNQVMLDSAGNVYVAGQSKCISDSDIVIIRYNPSDGSINWQKQMFLPGTSLFKAAILKNNYIYVTGVNNQNNSRRMVVIRCDLSGNTITSYWDRVGGDYGNAIATDNSGNVYVAGRTDVPVNYPKQLLVKFGPNLDTLWSYVYTGGLSGGFDEALAIAIDASNNSYITGYTSLSQINLDSYDYLTMKINSSGALQWAKKFDRAAREDEAYGITLIPDGSAFVTGVSYGAGTGSAIVTLKYSSNGDSLGYVLQQCRLNTLNTGTAITADGAGNIYVTGYGQCDLSNNYNYITLKYNSSLAQQWGGPITLITSSNNYAYAILYNSSYIYVTGESDSANGDRRFMSVKYDAGTGAEQWRWKINTSDSNYAVSIAVNSSGVFSSGYSLPDSMITSKYTSWISRYAYCPPFGIRIISNQVPSKTSLSQNYPNPFNPSTRFRFDIERTENVNISVFDALGKKVGEILNKVLTAGIYEATWDGNGFDSGVYFVLMNAGGNSASMRMVLIK